MWVRESREMDEERVYFKCKSRGLVFDFVKLGLGPISHP